MAKKFALDLQLPFETDMRSLAERDCDLTNRHHFKMDPTLADPRVLAWLDERGISLSHAEVFYTPPRALLPIHVDGPELSDITKLNWCWGGVGSKMLWWKLKKGIEPIMKFTGIGTRYLTMAASDCVTVAQHVIKSPTLVNVGQPHSVFNMGPEGRWVLSLVLQNKETGEPLQWNEAVERLTRPELPQ